uniref:BAH domain and coiled-coil containing 1 n=1 Tax=Scleropages formosus TaxID=113540 RepID=A0A8C9T3L7_SCLFO
MEGRDFAPPPHLLSERGALVHRATSRIASAGHGSVQHSGHFQTGKYYPSHLPMAPHSGNGLMGNSSTSFMGTFLTGSLGSPPSHPSHPSGPPASPSSPSFHGGPHSSASQIWFPHSHEAPGYPRFSGSLAHTFLPMSHLDHHGNSSVLYGQHPFYDAQKENFYLRGLPSQEPLLPANHGLPPVSRTASSQPLRSCSRERDMGGDSVHKSLKEGGAHRPLAPGTKEKERSTGKQEAKDRQQHKHRALARHKATLVAEYKDDSVARDKHLSACLLHTKAQNGSLAAVAKGSLLSCGGGGSNQGRNPGAGGNLRCAKDGLSPEMRISEKPSDCLERAPTLHHSMPYRVPTSLGSAVNAGGFHCLPLHPSGQDPKTTGPTFVPSVSHQGDKTNEPFQLRNPDCRRVGGGRGNGHAIPPTHLGPRPRSGDCINNSDLDFRPSLPQAGLSTPSFRNCSHLGLSTNGQVPEGKVPQGGGIPGGCVLQRDGQKVARIRHQQHHRAVSDDSGPKLGLGCSGAEGKRKTDMPTLGYVCGSGQQQPVPPWAVRASQLQVDEEQRKGYLESLTGGTVGRPQGQQQPLPGMGPPSGPQDSKGPQGEGGAMRNLLKYSSQQQPLLLSQRNPFGGLGCLKSGAGGDSCPVQGDKHALPSRKTPSADGDRPDCGRKSRESGDMPHSEGEVRQPPVGIAVAVARQREPTCHPMDGSTSHTRQDRMMPTLKGAVKPVFPLDLETEEERKRMCEEQLGRPCLERDRELLVRDNKKRVEFARIHPSSSCHGDITPHLMVPGGTSLQSSQLGADPTPHVHPAHHHWMSQTGSPSLWVTGHSYGIGHAALHQNLPPAFSAPMPGPLQPVLPLSQDSSTPLVVLSSEPTARPATHHLDVIEQPGLWPPVYGARGPPSHMQHATVFSQSQFLRQQEFYALQQQQQQQQQQQHRVAQSMELQHRSSHPQVIIRKTASSVSCPTRLSPCCRSPSLRPHPKSTPCTPCPTPSPAAAAPHSPALSPAPPRKTKGAEAQDMRAEGQPPQDYPQTLEPGKNISLFTGLNSVFIHKHVIQVMKSDMFGKGHRCLKYHWFFEVTSLELIQPSVSPIWGAVLIAERDTCHRHRLCDVIWIFPPHQVCPVKGAMETMGAQELAMRVQLAELQQRYKEKQRELAKLQRKHDHHCDSEGQDDIRVSSSRDSSSSSVVPGPSPSSVVKLEANQKARNKKERQGLYGKNYLLFNSIPLIRHLQFSPKGHAVSRLLESFATNEGFQIDEDSSFSEGDEDSGPSGSTPSCILTRKVLTNGLKVLVSKEDELMYAARVYTLELPDIYKIVIDGERGNRQRIYTLDQLVDEAVLDVCPETEELLTAGTRVCAYWSERSRCLYPGYVRRGSPGEEGKAGSVMVEFDDGDRGWISLAHIRLLPPDYQIRCKFCTNTVPPYNTGCSSVAHSVYLFQSLFVGKIQLIPKGSGIKTRLASSMSRNTSSFLSWPNVAVPKKKAPHNPFQVNGIPRKPLKRKKAETFPLSTDPATAATKGIFKSSFAVDSFSSIANGYSSFGSQSAVIPINPRSSLYSRNKKLGEGTGLQGRKAEFLVKLDHEGVTSPKTKSSKALLLHGSPGQGSQLDKGFGTKGLGCLTHPTGYSHPVLLVKDNKKGNGDRKPTPPMALAEYADFGMNCHSDCPSSYSDMDEEDEDERESALVTASGGLRTAGSFLSRLSVSSSSSGSSSSSSSGSLSSSSLCSSDNDSSYSSEDEESSTLLLQSCLSSQHSLLQTTESASGPLQGSFVAKAMAVAGTKSGSHSSTNSKPLKRKEYPNSVPKDSKDVAKRPKLQVINNQPKISSFLSAQQLWKWSGNPTQRRGMKGKARKLFYKAIVRGKDMVRVGDCAVFLSAGRPHLPYVGRIESFWESWAGSMVVKVKWFYHPEETKLGKRHGDGKHALYQSSHEDENDVQTISHKCQVVSREEYERLIRGRKPAGANHDLYYLAGTYDPTSGQLVTAEGLPILC